MGAHSHPKKAPSLMQRNKNFTSKIQLTRITKMASEQILFLKKKNLEIARRHTIRENVCFDPL